MVVLCSGCVGIVSLYMYSYCVCAFGVVWLVGGWWCGGVVGGGWSWHCGMSHADRMLQRITRHSKDNILETSNWRPLTIDQ